MTDVLDTTVSSPRDLRNPFGVMDVPEPDGTDVVAFASTASLDGLPDDANGAAWANSDGAVSDTIDGPWRSRWNGGADPTIAGDAPDKWKEGCSEARSVGDRVYLLFDWDDGRRKGLIEARREGSRLIGKYINLTNPQIIRPWTGLIVNARRIDGRWTLGRLDFRR